MSGAVIRKKRRFSLPEFIIGAILFLWMLIILYPFYNSVMISLVTQKEYLMSDFLLFPKTSLGMHTNSSSHPTPSLMGLK